MESDTFQLPSEGRFILMLNRADLNQDSIRTLLRQIIRQELDALVVGNETLPQKLTDKIPYYVQPDNFESFYRAFDTWRESVKEPVLELLGLTQEMQAITDSYIADSYIAIEEDIPHEGLFVDAPPVKPQKKHPYLAKGLVLVASILAVFFIFLALFTYRANPQLPALLPTFALVELPTATKAALQIIVDKPESVVYERDLNEWQDTALFADFWVDPYEGEAPLVVGIENFSEGPISRYEWDFDGDGIVDSEAENPETYTYKEAGEFILSLTIYDKQGNTDTYTEDILVYGEGELDALSDADFEDTLTPTATLTLVPSPTVDTFRQLILKDVVVSFLPNIDYGTAPLTVSFKNNSSGPIARYSWDFNGDGVPDSSDPNPTPYTYQFPGEYRPVLTLTTTDGRIARDRMIIIVAAPPPPIAYFEMDPPDGPVPLTVSFQSQSEGVVYTYDWDFNGDGQTDSTDANPVYTFQNPGDYRVRLIVNGPGGQSQASTADVLVLPPQEPFAFIDADPIQGTAPLVVNFMNETDGSVNSWAWDFDGDGVVDSTQRNPAAFTYTKAGTYQATLKVVGYRGELDSDSITITVLGTEVLAAKFTASPLTGPAPLLVNFTNESTGASSYEWDFDGDGVVDSNEKSPAAFTYTSAGLYQAKLTVTDLAGKKLSQTVPITVTNPGALDANFTVDKTQGSSPLSVSFNNLSTGSNLTYEWDFDGDGMIDSTLKNPTAYLYTTPKTYTAKLTVKSGSLSDSHTVLIQVLTITATVTATKTMTPTPTRTAVPLVADFSMNVDEGPAPLIVNFINSASGASTYEWDFNGDGIVDSTQKDPAPYTYTTAGDYEIRLVVRNASAMDEWTEWLTVHEPDPLDVMFSTNVFGGIAPLSVTFSNLTRGASSYKWDFNGDGIVDSTQKDPAPYIYSSAGNFTAKLTASNGVDSDSYSQVINVTLPGASVTPSATTPGATPSATPSKTPTATPSPTPSFTPTVAPPVASFTLNPNAGIAPLSVNLVSTSTGNITAYAWDINNDNITDYTGVTANHIFAAGNYTVKLTVSGPGGSHSLTQNIIVLAPSPTPLPVNADFSVAPLNGLAPLTVSISNLSSNYTTIAWDLNGDTVIDSSDAALSSYTFSVAGTYQMILKAQGWNSSDTHQITVVVSAP
ncbi:hypothetical protein MASR2M15_28590 [Anaerolineales bacterium]